MIVMTAKEKKQNKVYFYSMKAQKFPSSQWLWKEQKVKDLLISLIIVIIVNTYLISKISTIPMKELKFFHYSDLSQ